MVVSPFVEVLQSRPPARSLITPAEATFARYRPIRCDWWRLAVPWPSPYLGADEVCMIGGADLVGALGLGPGRRCPSPGRGRL